MAPDPMARIRAWFAMNRWEPRPFQEATWARYLQGEEGLLHVPTGSGKTYAAFLAPLMAVADAPGRTRILYVTPLRAVTRDLVAALSRPVKALELPLSVGERTGDTSTAERRRQRERLPDVLVTTPESLCVLLSRDDVGTLLGGVRTVIVDEWHALWGNKRGAQLELALSWLRHLVPGVQTWGMSATLADPAAAARALVGVQRQACVIAPQVERKLEMRTFFPPAGQSLPWAGHLGVAMAPVLAPHLKAPGTTLVFTNTRSQAEAWHAALRAALPDWEGRIALHHGSLDRETREAVEAGLKVGTLRVAVATSSLDLGVDYPAVTRVVQVGSVRSVQRLLQRAGRSGHRPDAQAELWCVPTHAMQLLELAALRDALAEGVVESPRPPIHPVDVLMQHLVTVACGEGFTMEAMFASLRQTATWEDLTWETFERVVREVAEGGYVLQAYPDYHRITEGSDGVYRVSSARMATRHRMSIGTIVADPVVAVRMGGGRTLGTVEERFASGLRPGDTFSFGGRLLRVERLDGLNLRVKETRKGGETVPRWAGGQLPISPVLSDAMRALLARWHAGEAPSHSELQQAESWLVVQESMAAIPGAESLHVECITERDETTVFLFPLEGRLAHEGLAMLLALRLTREHASTWSVAVNDWGLALTTPESRDLSGAFREPSLWLAGESLEADLREALVQAQVERRHFREVARVAGLVFEGYPNQRRSPRSMQMSAGLLFDVYRRHDPENLLLRQTEREVFRQRFEVERLSRILGRVQRHGLSWTTPSSPTPFALPLALERVAGQLSSEALEARVARLQRSWGAG